LPNSKRGLLKGGKPLTKGLIVPVRKALVNPRREGYRPRHFLQTFIPFGKKSTERGSWGEGKSGSGLLTEEIVYDGRGESGGPVPSQKENLRRSVLGGHQKKTPLARSPEENLQNAQKKERLELPD